MLQCIKNTKLAQFVPSVFLFVGIVFVVRTWLHTSREKRAATLQTMPKLGNLCVVAILCFSIRLTMENNFIDWKIHVQLLRTFCSCCFFFVHLRSIYEGGFVFLYLCLVLFIQSSWGSACVMIQFRQAKNTYTHTHSKSIDEHVLAIDSKYSGWCWYHKDKGNMRRTKKGRIGFDFFFYFVDSLSLGTRIE